MARVGRAPRTPDHAAQSSALSAAEAGASDVLPAKTAPPGGTGAKKLAPVGV